MPVFGTQMFGSGGVSSYEIDNSCIWNGTDAYMSRTPGSAGNQKTMTQSMWVKRAKLSTDQTVGINTSNGLGVWFNGDDTLTWYCHFDSGWEGKLKTTQVFRDPGAWYHIVVNTDTTQAVAANRAKVYVNGSQLTAFSIEDYPDQNDDTAFNAAAAHSIGIWLSTPSYYYNGYVAEMHWIDGTALTPSSFGETNDEGVWVPKKYSGSYGTTGFYLDFADSGDLGDDESGQGNDWAETNIAASDQSTDTPTNNHCMWNPAFPNDGNITLSEGARNFSHSGGDQRSTIGTMFPRTGKWYHELKIVSLGGSSPIGSAGISQVDVISQFDLGDNRHDKTGISLGYRFSDGQTYFNSSVASFGDSLTTNDICGIAWDADNGKCYFAKNNTWQNSGDPTSGATGTGAFSTTLSSDGRAGGWGPSTCNEASDVYEGRFTEAEWSYSAPTGYKAFCTASLETPALKDPSTNFQAVLFTGTGSSRSVTNDGNSNMQPDIIWIGGISDAYNKGVFDAARGTQKELQLNSTAAETTLTAGISSFDSDGFSFNGTNYNTNTYTFVAWQWSAGNSGASNEAGSINTTTTYSDSTAGISLSTYTGTGSAATIGHGLGVAPKMIIIKNRSTTDAWKVYHSGVASDPQTDYLVLNTNAASVDDSTVWNDTAPTSTVFSIGTHTDVNTDDETYVAYAFAEVSGFSKFGIYTGNGDANGTFAYCGFKPAFAIIKRIDSTGDWPMKDTARSPDNEAHETLYADTTAANFGMGFDILSNGFKPKTTDATINADGGTYIFMAFAESPFGGEDVSPATAR